MDCHVGMGLEPCDHAQAAAEGARMQFAQFQGDLLTIFLLLAGFLFVAANLSFVTRTATKSFDPSRIYHFFGPVVSSILVYACLQGIATLVFNWIAPLLYHPSMSQMLQFPFSPPLSQTLIVYMADLFIWSLVASSLISLFDVGKGIIHLILRRPKDNEAGNERNLISVGLCGFITSTEIYFAFTFMAPLFFPSPAIY